MDRDEDFIKLIKLKRYERPPERYVEKFLADFHSRQRSELLKGSATSIFFERLATYASSFGGSRLAYGAGAACVAALALIFLGVQNAEKGTPVATPAGQELPFRAEPAQPLPLPHEIVPYPLEAYPERIQKVSAEGEILLREF